MIDTHCHLTYPDYQPDFADVIARAQAVGVTDVVIPGTDLASSAAGLALAGQYPFLRAAAAIHPIHAHEVPTDWQERFEHLVESGSFVAIGEIGLDYYHMEGIEPGDATARTERIGLQKSCLDVQLAVAHKHELPIIVHSRECFTDLHAILKAQHHGKSAVIHCFTGTLQEAFAWLDLGFLISFTGILTYKKSTELREIAAAVPLDRLMIETDGPYLAPEGSRGKRCEPQHVRNVAECLAEVRGISVEEIDRITTHTARQFFTFTD